MKFVIFEEIFFSDTHFINEIFEKINFHEENIQRIMFSRQNFPKMGNFKEYFSLLSLHPFLCKEFSLPRFSLFAKNLCLSSTIIWTWQLTMHYYAKFRRNAKLEWKCFGVCSKFNDQIQKNVHTTRRTYFRCRFVVK